MQISRLSTVCVPHSLCSINIGITGESILRIFIHIEISLYLIHVGYPRKFPTISHRLYPSCIPRIFPHDSIGTPIDYSYICNVTILVIDGCIYIYNYIYVYIAWWIRIIDPHLYHVISQCLLAPNSEHLAWIVHWGCLRSWPPSCPGWYRDGPRLGSTMAESMDVDGPRNHQVICGPRLWAWRYAKADSSWSWGEFCMSRHPTYGYIWGIALLIPEKPRSLGQAKSDSSLF